jgi:hypothetical protein
MSCTPPLRTIRTVTATVFSKGGTAPGASEIFVLSPQSVTGIAPMLAAVRVTVIVENATADFISQAVFQTTSDGEVWDNPVALESAASDNRKFTTNWYNAANAFKRGIRIGVIASQETGVTSVQMARVTLIIDFQLLK